MKVKQTLTATGALVLSVTLLTGFSAPVANQVVVASSPRAAITAVAQGTVVSQMHDSEVFSAVSNPSSFKDLPKSHWAYSAIMTAVQKGYFKGYADGTFKPNDPVTRAEFAVLMSRVSTNEATLSSTTFNDIPSGHWAESGVSLAVQKGFINAGTYVTGLKPSQAITRKEMSQWMANGLAAANAEYKQAMEDVKNAPLPIQEHYTGKLPKSDYGVVGLMMGTKLMTGMTDGAFGVDKVTTRAEVATILLRLEEAQKKAPSDFKNLVQLRELGTTGTNAISMGYTWGYDYSNVNRPTFQDEIKDKEFELEQGWGKAKMHHIIIIDPTDTDSIFYPVFFGKDNNMNRVGLSDGTQNILAVLTSITPAKAGLTSDILFKVGRNKGIIGGGTYRTGTETTYKVPTFARSMAESFYTNGVTRTYYEVSGINSKRSKLSGGVDVGVRFDAGGKRPSLELDLGTYK